MTSPLSPEVEDLTYLPERYAQQLLELRERLDADVDIDVFIDDALQLAEDLIERLRRSAAAGALLDVGRNELTVPLARSIAFKPSFLPPAEWHPSPVPVLVVTLGHPPEQAHRPGLVKPPAWTHFVLQVLPDLDQADVVPRFHQAVAKARRLSP